jgi:XRE family aerobic/anaerobic benzoate catabolism transcriptional regulator
MTTSDRAHAEPENSAFLGDRRRMLRARRGVTRRGLSRRSHVSERHIAQIEAGRGNISILLLRRIARALGLAMEELVGERPERSVERRLLEQVVAQLPEAQMTEARLAEACGLLLRHFRRREADSRSRRIALVGLRGAGKSMLGRMLAARLGIRFVKVEREGRMDLSDLFAIHGQEGFRRLEREALQRLVREGEPAVIATGGIVAEAPGFEFLLDTCTTIWLRASPAEHMRRIVEQGDTRPVRDNRRAMEDLRAILASREALYAKADLAIDTTGQAPEASLEALLAGLHRDVTA